MVNLLAVKITDLITVTNCYIVDFQDGLFVSSHQDCLLLSYCGILMHINSLQHIVALHFVQIQQHPLDYMLLLLFYWDPHSQGTGFSLYHYGAYSLYNCPFELHPRTHYMGNYMKRTLGI